MKLIPFLQNNRQRSSGYPLDCSQQFTNLRRFWPQQPANTIVQKSFHNISVGLYQRPPYDFAFRSPPELILHVRRSNTPWQEGYIDGGPSRRLASRCGDLFLLPPNVNTHWRTPIPSRTADLLLKPALLEHYAAPPAAARQGLALRYELTFFRDALLDRLCTAIIEEIEREEFPDPLYVDSLAHAIAARIVKAYSTAACGHALTLNASSKHCRRRISQVLDYVDAHLDSKLSLSVLAKVACMSPFHFARSFKQATGQAPHGYVTTQRIERARGLLRDSNLSISEVARKSGFSNSSHFSTSFKRATGQTPRQFRAIRC